MAYEDSVFATFYDDAVKNASETRKRGYPVFDEITMIEIRVPNQLDVVQQIARDDHKKRFPKSWEAYKTGKEPSEEGFPIDQWPQVTTGEVKMCVANGIKTVEQLAATADANLHRLGNGGMALKLRAQKFLESADRNRELERQNAELQAKVDELEKKLEAKPQVVRKKTTTRKRVNA